MRLIFLVNAVFETDLTSIKIYLEPNCKETTGRWRGKSNHVYQTCLLLCQPLFALLTWHASTDKHYE